MNISASGDIESSFGTTPATIFEVSTEEEEEEKLDQRSLTEDEILKQPPDKSTPSGSVRTSRTMSSSRSGSIMLTVDPSVLRLVDASEHSLTSSHMLCSSRNISIVDEDPNHPEEERKTSIFCGSCCDILLACIIVDTVHILSTIPAYFVGFDFFKPIEGVSNDGMDDDYTFQDPTGMRNTQGHFIAITVVTFAGIFFATLGLVGAACFQKHLVLTAAVAYCLGLVASCVFAAWPSAVLKGVFAYPHFALFLALHKGRITRENYASTERYCCCCKDDDNKEEQLQDS